ARGGSKGLPGKNIKLLGGKPLIAYSIDAAKQSSFITHTIVSTDNEETAKVARECGGDVPFMRPPELATDTTGHVEVMQHAVKFMEDKLGITFDYAVIFQPTSPFRIKDDVDGTIQKLIDTGADSAVSLVEVESANHPMKIKKLEGDRVRAYCMDEPEGARRQDLPKAYRRSSAVYAMKRDLLMKEGKLYGEFVAGYVTPKERFIDIDTSEDWTRAESMLNDLRARDSALL
ncbi:MAG: acylneuraminate cytidylyltransferase family protein, partial [Patescibacteria group bacterium]|nr:acylneuraminate cytidylyltransferase family protein [Patescibacteria group bacterium]